MQELSREYERPSVQTEKYSSSWGVPGVLPVESKLTKLAPLKGGLQVVTR